jgi:hypothetical protein
MCTRHRIPALCKVAVIGLCCSQQTPSPYLSVDQILFFKLVEEENPALLLHLPKVFVENCFFNSAPALGCWLVEATPQGPIY